MNQEELERIAARLGERAAARLNVDRTAAAVVARLRAPVRTAHWWERPAVLKMAAAVALMVGGGTVAVKTLRHTVPAEASAPVIASLQALSSDELEEVFDSLATDATVNEGAPVGLHDLTSEQLRELLQRMEG
jgi:hypothetical protein